MLRLDGVCASYGAIQALEAVSLQVRAGQLVCLLGANGAGKSTTLNCISGVVQPTRGAINFRGEDIGRLPPERIVAHGIVQVPEGREIFPSLCVEDNLRLGLWTKRHERPARDPFERIYAYFPVLKQRARQAAGTLSGGEQQMLMIGRALMSEPQLLLLDEPSLGLSPVLVDNVFGIIRRLNAEGLPILLVEQNARLALSVSDYCYILENGEVVLQGECASLADDPRVKEAYLGG